MYKFIKETYEEIYSRLNNNPAYVLKCTANQTKQIENFVSFIEKEIGSSVDETFLFDFIVFQFERRKDMKTRFGVGKIPLNHIIGKKAWEFWLRKSDNWKYWSDVFIARLNMKRPVLMNYNTSKVNLLTESEERIRANFYSEKQGLIYCSDLTTLYNKESSYCQQCINKEECINLQNEIYPNHGKANM